MRRPRVLLVAPWVPLPFDAGSRRVWTACRYLADRFDFHLLAFARREVDSAGEALPRDPFQSAAGDLWQEARYLRGAFARVEVLPLPSAPHPRRRGPLWLPDDVGRFADGRMSARVREILRAGEADMVHIEFDLAAPYVLDVRAAAPATPCLLTQHDMGTISLFRSYFRELAGGSRWRHLPDWARRVLYTRSVCRAFDRVVVLSEPDRRRLELLIGSGRARLVPTGVDLRHFEAPPPRSEREPERIVYVGHYPHYPNEDAVLWFCREILPRLRALRPGVRFTVVGSSPTPAIRELARRDPGIEVTGTVDDVKPYEAGAMVLVAPVRLGRGIKGKLLEAFATGTPVVATSVANDGVGAEPGTELLVEDRPEPFARAVARLLSDPELWGRLSANGRRLAERRHSWELRAGELEAVYREALGAARS